jgi:hypothetical protein
MVRCDYLEATGSDSESAQHSPEQHSLSFSPSTESKIEHWQSTGSFPYPDLQVFPPPPTQEYSKNELRLIHHLTSVSNELRSKGVSMLTTWTEKVPKFLSLAATYPYVMHALLSFSANNIAWTRSSNETRNLQMQHGTIALRGLHEAIGNFSHANADAALATSLLLLWQATDWQSWSSLRTGIQSVLMRMQSWTHESIFAEFITEEGVFEGHNDVSLQLAPLSLAERSHTLQTLLSALQRLQTFFVDNEAELHWTSQLFTYIESLQSSTPAQTPEEQFSHLYLLRKWLFWVPALLLQRPSGQGPAMLTLAYFYSAALVLEPLFPALGPAFCARSALVPLENIINITNAMHSQYGADASSQEIVSLMQFPCRAAMLFRSRHMLDDQSQSLPQHSYAHQAQLHTTTDMLDDNSLLEYNPNMLAYTDLDDHSSAYAPASMQYGLASTGFRQPYLEAPTSLPSQHLAVSDFTHGAQSWGTVPSPGFPPRAFAAEAADAAHYDEYHDGRDNMHNLMRGDQFGCVPVAPIWT